jgi:hypothetical protein
MPSLLPQSRTLVFDNAGRLARGALAYVYVAGTSTPATVYSDAAQTTPLAHPFTADSNGRLPMAYLPYETTAYKIRLATSRNAIIFEDDNIPNVDPASGSGGGGGGGDRIPAGSVISSLVPIISDDWIALNGQTIGSASSGAGNANALNEDVFIALWNALPNTVAPVVTGRGASAAADWAANKRLTLPNGQCRALAGVSGMGGTPTNLFGALFADVTQPGSVAGSATHTLTVNELANFTPTGTATVTYPSHTYNAPGGLTGATSGSNFSAVTTGVGTLTTSPGNTSVSLAINAIGGNQPHNNTQPTLLVWYFVRR